MKCYRAFSLLIKSEINLDVLPELTPCNEIPDIRILRGDASGLPAEASAADDEGFWYSVDEHTAVFNVRDDLWFRVENGDTVTVYARNTVPDGLLQSYILGNCFGAILQQRGILLLHGSCVCRNGSAYIITGDSGSGKSTLAREFLRNGWKLVTDDVSAISFSDDGIPYVIPSYPSQKLWQDAIDRYGIDDGNIRPLWQEERKDKFHADASKFFTDSKAQLCGIVWLLKGGDGYHGGCRIQKADGFSAVEIMMRNMYCAGFRKGAEKRNLMFQQCVDLSSRIKAFTVIRDVHGDTADELYRLVENAVKGEK